MTSLFLTSEFLPSLYEKKQQKVLKYRRTQTSMNCKQRTSCFHIAAGGGGVGIKKNSKILLPTLLTPAQRRDVTMWRCNSWIQLICVVSLLGNIALTAATTGK